MRTLTDQERARREKLTALRNAGYNPYPARIDGTVETVASVRSRFETLQKKNTAITIAGRVRALRLQGGSMFIDIDDGTGKFQCFLASDTMPQYYTRIVEALDLGDFVSVHGLVFLTKRGEQTVKAERADIIAKALQPPPDKRHGLTDTELRYRHRELDLFANPDARATFVTRNAITSAIRAFLDYESFLEIDTPVLQPIPGGATARPFVTHHHALDIDLYLRIAPELYLKRLIVGGFRRIYEIARCFRNEGIDYSHNPEFTQVELYAAYMDYRELMKMTERLLISVVKTVTGTLQVMYEKKKIDFTGPYPTMTFRDALMTFSNIDINECPDVQSLFKKVKTLKIDVADTDHRGKILDELFKTYVRPSISKPTFIIDHPIELSPLAKKKDDDPRYVERFQLVVAGYELANAFSELNDPDDQRQRFLDQEALRKTGDTEAQRFDEDYLTALEYGMPPTAGLGLGIDRLTMILTNSHSIKEVIAFPTLKPKV